MDKLLVMPLKSLGFLAAMRNDTVSLMYFFTYILKIDKQRFLYIDPCPCSNSQKLGEIGKMLYNICEKGFIFTNFITCSKQIYENINSFIKIQRI